MGIQPDLHCHQLGELVPTQVQLLLWFPGQTRVQRSVQARRPGMAALPGSLLPTPRLTSVHFQRA